MTDMNYQHPHDSLHLPLKASVASIIIAFSAVSLAADDDDLDPEVLRLIKPESSFSLGIGSVSTDNQRYGMYNGQHESGVFGIGEFSLVRRDDVTGIWLRAQGRNLGIPQAELRLEHERQGHWQYFVEFDQFTRYSPYTLYSNLQGVGTNTLTYPSTSGAQPRSNSRQSDLRTERLNAKLGYNHLFSPELELRVLFQNTEKKGGRLFGRGNSTAQEFLVEPIDTVTRQLDVIVNYTGSRLQLSGGYYGSLFQNANTQLDIAGGDSALRTATGPNLPFTVISLPPDNIAHQLHLAGAYQFAEKTNGTFKLAYSTASQHDSFASVPAPTSGALPTGGLNMSGRSDLGGKIETTLINLGLTSRPIKNLSLLANVRYEDRNDATPIARYINVTSATSTTDGYNEPRSLTTLSGKFEATYQLPAGYRLTAGVDYEEKERSISGVRVVGYRERTEEISERIELKKSLAEDINGSIAFIHSDRTGSSYGTLQTWNATTGQFVPGLSYSNRIQPIYVADRVRDKIRLFGDWTPVDPLNIQLAVEGSADNYGAGRDSLDVGVRQGSAQLYSLDATWTISEKWRVNGWVSRSTTTMNQADGNSAVTLWTAALNNQTDTVGLGMRGRLTGAIDVGADAMVSRDASEYRHGGAAASTPIPDIHYDQTTVKLFGRYALDRESNIRLDYVFDQRKTDDWTWNGTATSGAYVYTDGSWLYQNPNQKVHFFGLTYNYTFR
jgi:MtrB/PioB family decaheme-associated outer membrane protein